MKKHIIGLSGLAGSGKDTTADILATHAGFIKIAFADALRAEISGAYGVNLDVLTDPQTKHVARTDLALRFGSPDFRNAVAVAHLARPEGLGCTVREFFEAPRSPRQIAQWWGTEYRRNQDADYWVRHLNGRVIDYVRNGADRIVITDVRFRNEANAIARLGGCMWRVTRPGINVQTTLEGAHESVNDGSEFDPVVTVKNAGSILALRDTVLQHFAEIEFGLEAGAIAIRHNL